MGHTFISDLHFNAANSAMDLLSVVQTVTAIITRVDICISVTEDLSESLKSLKDRLSSTKKLFEDLSKLVKGENNDTSYSALYNY